MLQVHFSSLELLLQNIPPARNWFPVSVILTAQVINLLGLSEFNARLVSVIFGVITIPVLYFPIKRILNTRIALITVSLLAVSSWHLDWSQNARGYTSLMMFYSLALFAFYFGLEKDRSSYFLLFFFFLYLATSERMIALFILPVIVIYLLVLKFLPYERPPGFRANNLYILLPPAVLSGIYLIYSYIIKGESVIGAIFNEIVTTFVGKPIENPLTQATFLVFTLGVPLFSFALFVAVYLVFQINRKGIFFALGALVPFFLVILLTPFMFTEERYALVTLPSWLILAAIGINELLTRMKNKETLIAVGILAVLLFDAMGGNLLYFHTNHGNRRDWREAFSIVQENMHEGDVVVSTWPELGNYYLKSDVTLWEDMDLESIQNIGQRVWFVVIPDMAWYTGTEDFYGWVEHNTRMIKTIYIRTVDNTNIEIYLFDPSIIGLESIK
jgi:mannosyltransferase